MKIIINGFTFILEQRGPNFLLPTNGGINDNIMSINTVNIVITI